MSATGKNSDNIPLRIAVTGKPGCGKTTLCKKIAESLGGRAGGLITEEIREGGRRVGFRMEDIATGEQSLLAHVNKCTGPKVGKYSVCLEKLNNFSPDAIERGFEKDVLIIDEIGPMELKSSQFVSAVRKALDTNINCLFTIHRKCAHPLGAEIREKFFVKTLTPDSRNVEIKEITRIFVDNA